MISLRALGLLTFIEFVGSVESAEEIAGSVKEGRDAIQTALGELRELGYIATKRTRIGNRYVTRTYPLKPAFQALGIRSLSPQSQQNSYKSLIPIHTETVTISSNESMKEDENMGYEFFEKKSSMDDDERRGEAAKHRAEAQREWEEKKQRIADERRENRHRSNRKRSDWTSIDVAYEFADRSREYWNIPPWSVNKSRFANALASMRKTYNTDGEIEAEAIDWFFRSISVDKYSSGEHLWKMFITRFPEIINELKSVIREDDEVSEEELLRTAKALKALED